MPILSSDHRNLLANCITAARGIAEDGAQAALMSLAVHHYEPYATMSTEQRQIRNLLRAHGRQLGDKRNQQNGTQEILSLTRECAYQHWHQMLFARFLIESGLLIEPTYKVPVSMQDCEELARESRQDVWAMAGGFAQRMLPGVFRPDDPALAIALPLEKRQALEQMLSSLPHEVFIAEDSLGWTYQFWQAEEKQRVNDRVDSGEKIDGRALPAVTQLFTDDYMVRFLLHNSLGAWYAGKMLGCNPSLAQKANDEEELRRLVSPLGYSLDYLRFVKEQQEGGKESHWKPASGAYKEWPAHASELTILDPCCGSGHFLVAAFELMVRIRVAEERLSLEEAIQSVLSKNIYGLELDARCTQIAAFNLALSAWRLAGRHLELPPLNIACSGLAVGVPRSDWLRLANDNEMLKNGMDNLFTLFQQAPELGSLIDPGLFSAGDLITSGVHELRPLLEQALSRADLKSSLEQTEIGVSAQGINKASELLGKKYHLVITNVPYLKRAKQAKILRDYCEKYHQDAKNDLATTFMNRCLQFCHAGGTASLVMPQNWLFQTSDKRIREKLLGSATWDLLAWLGAGAFEGISGEVVKAILLNISNINKPLTKHTFNVIDAIEEKGNNSKSRYLVYGEICNVNQTNQLLNPDARITHLFDNKGVLLSKYAYSYHGLTSGDKPRMLLFHWEVLSRESCWFPIQGSVIKTMHYGGNEQYLRWCNGTGAIDELLGARKDGLQAWGRKGILINQMVSLNATLYSQYAFNNVTAVMVPYDSIDFSSIWCFCSSPEYHESVRRIDKKLNVTSATLAKIPFDLQRWKNIAEERYPNGLPKPYSDDPTQWIFHGHPCGSIVWDEDKKQTAHSPLRVDDTVLHVAVARLLGYQWPAERDKNLELCDRAREWVNRCEDLDGLSDQDGIVCLSSMRGEAPAADRLRVLLRKAYGDAWSSATERRLLAACAGSGRPAESLEGWLRDNFFTEHCKMFLNRPFIWHIWDGRIDGFHALVNYHNLTGTNGKGRRTLEALAYTYLGDWISLQRAGQREGVEGADARLVAAQELQKQLVNILEGEAPYDLFIRWKPLSAQPIGWQDVDANDGVRLNIRPFMNASLSTGRAGAGILRTKPGIDWRKDRGAEPDSGRSKKDYPWFWSCEPVEKLEHTLDFSGGKRFDGNRWNNLHYSRNSKMKARAEQ